MDYENKPKAVIVKTFIKGFVELRLSEKGAVVMYKRTDRGEQFISCLRPTDVLAHAEQLQSPAFQEIVASPEWAAIQSNRETAKAQRYIETKSHKETLRATMQIQAAMEKLSRLGVDPSALLKKQA